LQYNDFIDSEGDTAFSLSTHPDAPPEGERWSTWDAASHGPVPRPDWVITDAAAVDSDLGVLKTGKEADVHLVERWVPGTERGIVMAAKRFRTGEHRLFHRDAGYLEGRRVRRSREMRAMARRTEFGRELVSGQWAFAEFAALTRLWELELSVPYPIQLDGREMLMEFIGEGRVAAPRLAQARPPVDLLPSLFEQFRSTLVVLSREGWAHGDLSPYNVLLRGEQLVFIDWPQIVDIVGNPQGFTFLERDVITMCTWFTQRGYAVDAGELLGELIAEATGAW
jgi:RIO kinase 1